MYLVLPEQERQQHQHASIMHDPPNINVALCEALSIGRVGCNVLGNYESQVACSSLPDNLCKIRTQTRKHTASEFISDL